MVIGRRNRCHGCAAGSVVDRLRCGSRDAAVGSGGICQDVGVDGKAGRHRYISRHIAVHARIGCVVVAPLHKMVIGCRNRCHGCAAGSVVNRLRCGSRDAAVGSGGICQDVGDLAGIDIGDIAGGVIDVANGQAGLVGHLG